MEYVSCEPSESARELFAEDCEPVEEERKKPEQVETCSGYIGAMYSIEGNGSMLQFFTSVKGF